MCGFIGYMGSKQTSLILLVELNKLKYRYYDSTGMVVRNGENALEAAKAKDCLRVLSDKMNDGDALAEKGKALDELLDALKK